MTATIERPPQRVCAAFGVTADELRPPGIHRGWHSGRIELRPVTDTAETLWAAHALGSVSVPDLRIAQPARATDGRQVVGGWKAYRTADGEADTADDVGAAPGFDDIVLVSVKLHQAVAHL
ncbi:MAG: TIGR02569 family protein, partial [Actinophytocola sp.]|nr:TIGR02569 family protein [Actinophytocola sp.]